jgi:hypothetical protein
MARAAVLGRLNWQAAQVVDVADETPRVKTITFDVPDWRGHRAGQHVDIRLTAEDGYQAQRSYSISSAPADGTAVALTVERLDDGEVSPYLTDELRLGDTIELRGPIGGYFVWEPSQGGPLLLVGGGSGVAPLMAMIRVRDLAGSDAAAGTTSSTATSSNGAAATASPWSTRSRARSRRTGRATRVAWTRRCSPRSGRRLQRLRSSTSVARRRSWRP